MRIVILLVLLTLPFAECAFAKIDPEIAKLEKQLNTVKSNSEKVKLQISIARKYLITKNAKCDEYCKAAIKLAERNKLDNLRADALSVQGDYYYRVKKYQKASASFLAEYNIRKARKQIRLQANAAYNLGLCYEKMPYPAGGYKKSKKYLEEALSLAKRLKNKAYEEEIAEQLYILAYNSGKYKDATEYIKNNLQGANAELRHDIKELQDSVIELDSTIVVKDSLISVMLEENAKLDTTIERNREELTKLTKNQLISLIELDRKQEELYRQQSEIKRRNLTIAIIITVSVSLMLILLLLWRRYAEKKKLNSALTERNKVIAEQNVEINSNLKIINQKNRDITDSLNYAGKIQKSLLRNFTNYSSLLAGYFILYLPKDIVSGDFYWGHQIGSKFVFTVGDCTGHSVPGAFMSMLGISLLNQIVGQQHIIKASEILEQMRISVKLNLGQSGDNDEEAKDGMDMAMCVWDMEKGTINYSGAYNPMFWVRAGQLSILNPEKCPVGIHAKELDFTDQFIEVKKGDRIYLFSDGFSDQFGGPKFEKFKLARFKKLLADTSHLPMLRQYDKLESAFKDWKQDNVQIDDVCVLGLEI